MYENVIKVGNKVRVKPEEEEGWYLTKIVRVMPERFMVDPPTSLTEDEKYATGTVGMRLKAELLDSTGVYLFDTELMAFSTELGRWILRFPTNIQRMQRRKLFRLETLLNVKFKLPGDPQVYAATATDISGGGTQIVHWKDIPVGTELDLVLELPGSIIPVRGRVVNKEVLEEVADKVVEALGVKPKFSYGLQFIRIDQLTQDDIVRFIFARQREILRRRPVS